MAKRTKELTKLNDQLNEQMDIILRCTIENKKYGRLLLASPPSSRYPYVYLSSPQKPVHPLSYKFSYIFSNELK